MKNKGLPKREKGGPRDAQGVQPPAVSLHGTLTTVSNTPPGDFRPEEEPHPHVNILPPHKFGGVHLERLSVKRLSEHVRSILVGVNIFHGDLALSDPLL